MKKQIRKTAALLLAAIMVFSVFAVLPASASENNSFTLNATSNFFPTASTVYSDISQYADENGDVFVTVEYKMRAPQKYLINIDLDELTWDKNVLEFKEAYNKYGTGRRAVFTLLPFAYEQYTGAGVFNTFDDSNYGRIVGNYTSVSPAAYGYEEDGSAITVFRIKFKLINPNAGHTTVNCKLDTLSLDDETDPEPRALYTPINKGVIYSGHYALADYSTAILPKDYTHKGDIDGNGELSISDVTDTQRFLAEMYSDIDFTDPVVSAQADANRDGMVDVRDVTAMQRFIANLIDEL